MAMAGNDVVIEAFTELAPRYEETMDWELRELWGVSYEDFVNRLMELVPLEDGDVVLDVATGTARIPLKIASQAGAKGRIVGLDITWAMLRQGLANVEARGLTPRIGLVCASAMEMPFVEGVFDVVICGLGMHHMDVPQVLSEMRRVLREGGRLVMACVGAPRLWRSFWGSALLRILLARYRLTHRNARGQAEVEAFPNIRTASEWCTLLWNSGFGEIRMAESSARRPWYPCALLIRAVARRV